MHRVKHQNQHIDQHNKSYLVPGSATSTSSCSRLIADCVFPFQSRFVARSLLGRPGLVHSWIKKIAKNNRLFVFVCIRHFCISIFCSKNSPSLFKKKISVCWLYPLHCVGSLNMITMFSRDIDDKLRQCRLFTDSWLFLPQEFLSSLISNHYTEWSITNWVLFMTIATHLLCGCNCWKESRMFLNSSSTF